MELVEPAQMKFYESNTYRKDLSWLYFDDKSRVQDWQQVKENPMMKSKYFCRAFQLNNKVLHVSVPINFAVWEILIILFCKPQQRLYLKSKFLKNELKMFYLQTLDR